MKLFPSLILLTLFSLLTSATSFKYSSKIRYGVNQIQIKPPEIIFHFTGTLKNGCRVSIQIFASSETYPDRYPYEIGLRCGDKYGTIKGYVRLNHEVLKRDINHEIIHEYDDDTLREEFISSGGEEEVDDIMINALIEFEAN